MYSWVEIVEHPHPNYNCVMQSKGRALKGRTLVPFFLSNITVNCLHLEGTSFGGDPFDKCPSLDTSLANNYFYTQSIEEQLKEAEKK